MGTPTNFNDIIADSVTTASIVSTGINTSSVEVAITAFAGGGQTSARALTKRVNSIDTVATAADSVKLPLAVAGASVYLTNNTANSMQVFGAGTDTINIGAGDVATATGVAHAANKTAEYICTKAAPAGKWQRNMTA